MVKSIIQKEKKMEKTDRYEDAPQEVLNILGEVRDKYFPHLVNAHIKMLLDNKKRVSQKKLLLGKIIKPNDLVKHFVDNDTHYVIVLDKVGTEILSPEDKIRLIRHELRHAFIDEKGNYIVIPHDYEDFEEEIKLNAEDVGWAHRAVTMVSDVYAQREEQAKEAKRKPGGKRGRPRKNPAKIFEG